MKGRAILIEPMSLGRDIAALVVDGRLEDLFFDLAEGDLQPRLGAIYRGVPDRLAKGMHGAMVRLADGQMGFLRETSGLSPGKPVLVQVSTLAEAGKAVPVTTRLIFKSRHAIVTPGAAGINISRRIRDEDVRERLLGLAQTGMDGAEAGLGLILRSSCVWAEDLAIADDVAQMREVAESILAEALGREPALLLEGEGAATRAWTEWSEVAPDDLIEGEHSLDRLGVWEMIEALRRPELDLVGGAWMSVEATKALVAIDVNSGGDFSPGAALRTNIAAAHDIPRQLRLRGLGGKIVVDFAALSKKDRVQIEKSLASALKTDPVETSIAGWTPLGHLELNRKRERRLLTELLL